MIRNGELREDGLLKDIWHQRRKYVGFDMYSPRQRPGERRDHMHAKFAVAKLDEARFWDLNASSSGPSIKSLRNRYISSNDYGKNSRSQTSSQKQRRSHRDEWS